MVTVEEKEMDVKVEYTVLDNALNCFIAQDVGVTYQTISACMLINHPNELDFVCDKSQF
jgi:hypothetical protein